MFELYDIETRNLMEDPPSAEAAELIDHDTASRMTVLPLYKRDGRLWVAMQNPLDFNLIADLHDITGLFIEPVLAEEQDIRYFINQLYSSAHIKNIASQFLVDENIRKSEYQLSSEHREQIQSAPVVKLIDSLIESAVLYQASDIHIEPYEHTLRARFRVDGQLTNSQSISSDMLLNIISRLKIMGNLNIAERRLPQDASFSLVVLGKAVDFRLSIMPTHYGEKAVIRLLYSKGERLSTTELGFSQDDMPSINRLFSSAYGSVIITGPTGSGKTTTLTSFMSTLNKEDVNIITVEDPIENPIEGVNHVAIDPKSGLDFPRALRHILRQDPDIIMVGEIRDAETASIAMRAAITGHVMLTTLHTNDAAGVFPRLVDMGVEPFLVAAALNGVIAQRLVRRLCPFCKEEHSITIAEAAWLKIEPDSKVYAARGCNLCGKTGYKGRFALYEYIIIDDEMRNDLAAAGYDPRSIQKILVRNMSSMVSCGARNILEGNTSVEEVVRVVYRA